MFHRIQFHHIQFPLTTMCFNWFIACQKITQRTIWPQGKIVTNISTTEDKKRPHIVANKYRLHGVLQMYNYITCVVDNNCFFRRQEEQ